MIPCDDYYRQPFSIKYLTGKILRQSAILPFDLGVVYCIGNTYKKY